MRGWLVTHTHWDREWYRTYQQFRARLVDAVDRVLDLCAADPGYRFLLDGQTIALEDYAAIRPGRVAELRARIAEGRIEIGPRTRRAMPNPANRLVPSKARNHG